MKKEVKREVELMLKANDNIFRTDEERQKIIVEAAAAYEKFMDALKFNWREDPNSNNTPMRVAKAYVNDLITGCYDQPPTITAFPNEDGYEGMVFQGGIPVRSLCSHHHLPFTGVCHVAYLPSKKGSVIGLSKLNRTVEFYCRRPQIQEGLTMQIHNAINEVCKDNQGVAVMVSASHTCASLRGIKHHDCEMKTSKLSGSFMAEPSCRQEFYEFISNWKN